MENTQPEKTCIICLETFKKGETRGLLACGHLNFCFHCIVNWSEFSRKCPVCSSHFEKVQAAKPRGRGFSRGEVLELENYVDNTEDPEFLVFYMSIRCKVCQGDYSEEKLLLCDLCNDAFHVECLGMFAVPDVEEWYCSTCLSNKSEAEKQLQLRAMNSVSSGGN